MILRNLAIRHGRKALCAPLRRTITTGDLHSSFNNHIKETAIIESEIASQIAKDQARASGDYAAFIRRDQARLAEDAEEALFHSRRRAAERAEAIQRKSLKQHNKQVRGEYKQFKSNKKNLGTLGSVIDPFYEPQKLVTQPPSSKDVTLELLLASQAHMGHATSLWNPANQRYIHGIRQGIHIISLEQTAAHLRRAAKVVEGVARAGGLILFVGTRPNQDRAVVKAALNSKGCHLFERWIPGTLTNGDEILAVSRKIPIDEKDNIVESPILEQKLEDYKALKPDLVVCLNPLENYICLRECAQNNIPTIGIIDTDADPTWVTYPIPANDDSIRATNLIAGVLGMAGKSGNEKRLASEKPTWFTPSTFKEWVLEDQDLVAKYRARAEERAVAPKKENQISASVNQ